VKSERRASFVNDLAGLCPLRVEESGRAVSRESCTSGKKAMVGHVGTLLWEMRTASGFSMGRLARRASVSKATLSQWESGTRKPRVAELDAVLEAMNANAAQRALVFARIEAPRAIRRLRQDVGHGLGPPPSVTELLRGLRLRRGWTQERVAAGLGVDRTTVVRWERGERLPSTEQIHTLCYLLGAHEEEVVALTKGRFQELSVNDHRTLIERAQSVLWDPLTATSHLQLLALEHAAWEYAARDERARDSFATVVAYHAEFHRNADRWPEVGPRVRRILSLNQTGEMDSTIVMRAVILRAEDAVRSGHRPAPERGISILHAWLDRAPYPVLSGWMLTNIATYLALTGDVESATRVARQAVEKSRNQEIDWLLRRIDYAGMLTRAGKPQDALEALPTLGDRHTYARIYATFARVEAYLAMGDLNEAQVWLQDGLDQLAQRPYDFLSRWANKLARRMRELETV
jgi:transcriptional regulator with XRE-family HTH domain